MAYLRFLDTGSSPGAVNMAADEALLNTLSESRNHVYLRFYRWASPTMSFGHNQHVENQINLSAAQNLNIGLVRRMTGGKMVYHNLELTFSVGLAKEFIEAEAGKNKTFLEMFCFALKPMCEALRAIGVPARFSNGAEIKKTSANRLHCYAAAVGHSIFANDKKLIGAAGLFKNECLAIHGSIPIQPTFPPRECFVNGQNAAEGVNMASLLDFCTTRVINELPQTAAEVYADKLGIKLQSSVFTKSEKTQINELAKNKYSTLIWQH